MKQFSIRKTKYILTTFFGTQNGQLIKEIQAKDFMGLNIFIRVSKRDNKNLYKSIDTKYICLTNIYLKFTKHITPYN